ncbi:MAG: hypothetical protein Q9168_005965, partial [Polycauliona sp. 1 TL-2023]
MEKMSAGVLAIPVFHTERLYGEVPTMQAVEKMPEDQVRTLVTELLPALSEARMSAAHSKLQHNLLSTGWGFAFRLVCIDNAPAQDRPCTNPVKTGPVAGHPPDLFENKVSTRECFLHIMELVKVCGSQGYQNNERWIYGPSISRFETRRHQTAPAQKFVMALSQVAMVGSSPFSWKESKDSIRISFRFGASPGAVSSHGVSVILKPANETRSGGAPASSSVPLLHEMLHALGRLLGAARAAFDEAGAEVKITLRRPGLRIGQHLLHRCIHPWACHPLTHMAAMAPLRYAASPNLIFGELADIDAVSMLSLLLELGTGVYQDQYAQSSSSDVAAQKKRRNLAQVYLVLSGFSLALVTVVKSIDYAKETPSGGRSSVYLM